MVEFFLDYFSTTPVGMKILVGIGGVLFVGGTIKVSIQKAVKFFKFVQNYFVTMERRRLEDEEFKKSVLEMKDEVKKMSNQVQNLEQLSTIVESLSTENKKFNERLDNLGKSLSDMRSESRNADNHIIEQMNQQKETMDHQKEQILKMQNVLGLLVDSDEDEYRAKLLETLEKCKAKGNKVDTLTLSNIISGYKRYRAEGGNSWAEDIINQIRSMEIVPFPNVNYHIDTDNLLLGIHMSDDYTENNSTVI